jgi:hypothetical protein
MEQSSKQASEAMARTVETIAGTVVQVIDRLAGKQSDIKLSFEDLTLDAGILKAKMNGSVVLDVTMAKNAET